MIFRESGEIRFSSLGKKNKLEDKVSDAFRFLKKVAGRCPLDNRTILWAKLKAINLDSDLDSDLDR